MATLREQLALIMPRFPDFASLPYARQSEQLLSIAFLVVDMYPQMYNLTSNIFNKLRSQILEILGYSQKPCIAELTRKVAVLLTTTDRSRVLVHGNEPFDLPSGSIDIGENAVQAANRELFEETGIVVDLTNAQFQVIHVKNCCYFVYWKPYHNLQQEYKRCRALSDSEAKNFKLLSIDQLSSQKMRQKWRSVGTPLTQFIKNAHQDHDAVFDGLFA